MSNWKPNKKLLDEIVKTLENSSGIDMPIVRMGDRVFSTRDILKEIQQGTELGKEYVNSYEQLEKETLGEEDFNKKYNT
ncbi:hypothetical protein HZA97_02350 [Candidatus Woesearchaeota archaeon]|nr:hypothetical protein [Candidatus Woesearchaeota archaeon]